MDSRPVSSIPGSVLVAVGFVACCLGSFFFQYIRCSGLICFPDRDFTIYDLNLPLEFFPPDAIGGELAPTSERRWGTESAITTVYWGNGQGSAIYIVDQADQTERAARDYLKELTFHSFASYSKNDAFTYHSSSADEWSLDCGYPEFGGYRCRLVARYEEFILFFHATITEDVPIDRFEQIVIFLDEQMIRYLHSEVES